ncbi:uncharacterized protein isoform X1 [Musca autumnalis]|uniref:uncharacterized protein isoform X1 n=1 Tax=Musca autumnalis TaxID=221902 RepID=UPI003CEAE899
MEQYSAYQGIYEAKPKKLRSEYRVMPNTCHSNVTTVPAFSNTRDHEIVIPNCIPEIGVIGVLIARQHFQEAIPVHNMQSWLQHSCSFNFTQAALLAAGGNPQALNYSPRSTGSASSNGSLQKRRYALAVPIA